MAQVWIDKVSVQCKKCNNSVYFEVCIGVSDCTGDTEILDEIYSNYVDVDLEEEESPYKHGGNMEDGLLEATYDYIGYEFTCSHCLMEAIKKKKARAAKRKAAKKQTKKGRK